MFDYILIRNPQIGAIIPPSHQIGGTRVQRASWNSPRFHNFWLWGPDRLLSSSCPVSAAHTSASSLGAEREAPKGSDPQLMAFTQVSVFLFPPEHAVPTQGDPRGLQHTGSKAGFVTPAPAQVMSSVEHGAAVAFGSHRHGHAGASAACWT